MIGPGFEQLEERKLLASHAGLLLEEFPEDVSDHFAADFVADPSEVMSLKSVAANGVESAVAIQSSHLVTRQHALRGDLDFDGDVDVLDLTTMIVNFTSVGGVGKIRAEGDIDWDGDVDTFDLTITISNFTGARPNTLPFAFFGVVTVSPDVILNGQGHIIDSLAFWEAPDAADSLLFVTAKNNQMVEIWQFPFEDHELTPLTHTSFGTNTNVNGVAVDQLSDRLYVTISAPVSAVSVFSLPEFQLVDQLIQGNVNLKSTPNIGLFHHENGQDWVYVTADNLVHVHDAATGSKIGNFTPDKGLETIVADDYYQRVYSPDERGKTGIYAYRPDGSRYLRDGSNWLSESGVFQADAEGIVLYKCYASASDSKSHYDNGNGLIVVADQRSLATDFELFDRRTWAYLGTLRIEGVSNTDGIASTQQSLPGYPLGLFAAVHDDTSTVVVGWETILTAAGLNCDTAPSLRHQPAANI